MRTIVVFESMFGNTRQIADAIAEGLAGAAEVTVVNVNLVKSEDLEAADLVLVGGPTHVHGMSHSSTRAEAEKWTHDPAKKLSLESGAPGRGIREWLEDDATVPKNFAAFATRVDWPIIVSGNAAAQIDREFDRRGSHRLMTAENFVVTKDSELGDGEIDRAKAWGTEVGKALTAASSQASR